MKPGWEIKKLGELCTIQLGKTPYRKDSKFWDKYKKSGNVWLSISDLKHGKYIYESTEQVSDLGAKEIVRIPKGTLLLSFKLTLGRVSFAGTDLFTNEAIASLLNLKKEVSKEFLFYYFTLFDWDKAAEGDVKVKGKTLNKQKLKELQIPLPPLPEQQRIVSILDEAFAAIAKAKANAEKNLKNARELFDSYLQGVFEKKGDGWEEKILGELTDESCTLSYGIVQPGDEFENGLPVIRPTDLTRRYIKIEGLKKIDPKLADGYKRTKLVGDELLLCVRGTTGVVSIATPELIDANVTRGIVPIRFNSKIINQEFGYFLLISNYVQKQIKAKTYGAALMQINIGDLRKVLILYPPLINQQEIVIQLNIMLEKIKKLEIIYQNKIANLEELKKSILQKAFAGELKTENMIEA
jgi:type I restriction enzyme, S subunit